MGKSKTAAVSIVLILMILAVYWPVQRYKFLNFDDQVYVTDNSHVRAGLTWKNVKWALGSLDAGFWHPLTWLSLMNDAALYRLNAGGFHCTNVLLHISSALLLFLACQSMTGAVWQSGFVALLFAVHPLNVEPVTWISSRKDVLSGFFWMLTLWIYARYAKVPNLKRYLPVWTCFILGLMSKPMTATLPVVMLFLDFWPLKRFKTADNKSSWKMLILEKLPLAVCALAVIIVTFIAESRFNAISNMKTFSLTARIFNALVSYLVYIGKMIFPSKLAVYYPHPGMWPLWTSIGSGLSIILLTSIAFCERKRYPYFFVGWFWYLITLVPVIGFVQLGTLARADRYAYIPLIGIFIAVVWGGAEYLKGIKLKQSLFLFFAAAILICFSVASRLQVAHWRNELTLFGHAIRVTENNYKAYHGLGMAYHSLGKDEQAIDLIRHSISLKPDNRAHVDLGVVYLSKMRFQDAQREFNEALKLKPDNAKAYNNLGVSLVFQEKYDEAVRHFTEALRLDPCYENAQKNLKNATDLNNTVGENDYRGSSQ